MFGQNINSILSSLEGETPTTEIPQGEIPEYTFSNYSVALGAIRNLAAPHTDIFPIERVLNQLGVQVHFEEMESDNSGYIELRANGWHIGVNKFEVLGRQRFTLAHELAHLLFHRKMIKGRFEEAIKLFRSQENYKLIEMEANLFAAELLMPSGRFRELWQQRGMKEMAEIFGVSLYAIEYRALKLSLPRNEQQ